MPPVPVPFTTGTREPLMVPRLGTNLIDWNRDVAALQSSQIVAGLTLGDDEIAALADAIPPESIETTALALAGDVVAALGTMQTSASAGITLAGDSIAAASKPTTPGLAAFTLAPDSVFVAARVNPLVTGALTLAGDIVRALSGVQPITTAALAITLAGDVMHAAGTAAATSFAAPGLVLAGDVFVIPATAHPVTTATAGTTGHGVRLGDDAVQAIEGRAWASVNHRLGSDLVTAAGDVVMPPADTSVALTLADDVVVADPAANPPVTAAPNLTLGDDLVTAPTFADRPGGRWADPFSATEVADALLVRT